MDPVREETIILGLGIIVVAAVAGIFILLYRATKPLRVRFAMAEWDAMHQVVQGMLKNPDLLRTKRVWQRLLAQCEKADRRRIKIDSAFANGRQETLTTKIFRAARERGADLL